MVAIWYVHCILTNDIVYSEVLQNINIISYTYSYPSHPLSSYLSNTTFCASYTESQSMLSSYTFQDLSKKVASIDTNSIFCEGCNGNEDESIAYIVKGYAFVEENLLECPVPNSLSFSYMPNKAASVGYQDDVFMIDEEEDQDGGVSAVVLCNLSVMPCTSPYFLCLILFR